MQVAADMQVADAMEESRAFKLSSSYDDASTAPVVRLLPRLQRTFGV